MNACAIANGTFFRREGTAISLEKNKEDKRYYQPNIDISNPLSSYKDSLLSSLMSLTMGDNLSTTKDEFISIKSLLCASSFIDIMPTTIPIPDIMIHPDGEVAFEWQYDRNLVFTIAFAENSCINYAGLFREDKVYGTERFLDSIPESISFALKRLFQLAQTV